MSVVPFTAGLHRLAEHVYAWLQPDGGWGLSNAGLIQDGDQSLLIDTQFDLQRTRAMFEEMRQVTAGSPIRYASTPRLPDHHVTADGELRLGHRSVRLLRSGPAHTYGDVAVHDPDSGIVFTGDLLFIGSTPIMWAGLRPVGSPNWTGC